MYHFRTMYKKMKLSGMVLGLTYMCFSWRCAFISNCDPGTLETSEGSEIRGKVQSCSLDYQEVCAVVFLHAIIAICPIRFVTGFIHRHKPKCAQNLIVRCCNVRVTPLKMVTCLASVLGVCPCELLGEAFKGLAREASGTGWALAEGPSVTSGCFKSPESDL